ncbi:N-acyl-phosphatidylethanolamine-hydrolyzing phospholipase D [Russula earlei]|uniref:N-acyl-phosphatidylethanolamine-hydrolyzing phospholipase D n=1 Tax=Russula earlei TaxID=71964 RepID=A0ACC0UHS4_9AGAM|nr:N-acyl-phosphatidylethanolamine-hydrolyzing phospholipase D [Russula earlei]
MLSPPHIEVTEPARRFPPCGVDNTRPSHHLNDSKTLFGNPWLSFRFQSLFQWASAVCVIQFFLSRSPRIPKNIKSLVPKQTVTWGAHLGNESSAKATWLGHACYFVELPTPPGAARGVRIIFDPVFSNRCSPSKWLGPARFTDAPCEVEDIPAVDAIVLSVFRSSDACASTDIPTLRALIANPSSSARIFVALNNAAYLSGALDTPHHRFHELDWWDERFLRVALPSSVGGPAVNAEVRISCTPSQHVSGRTAFDRWHALWAAWVVDDLHSQKKLYFAGDTGYRTVRDGEDEEKVPVCPAFAEVGERFGGVDVALLPIGAYAPRAMWSNLHASPADAVRMFKDVRAKKALAMHWGTWVLTSEPVLEPPELLRKECEVAGVDVDEFLVPALGETVMF